MDNGYMKCEMKSVAIWSIGVLVLLGLLGPRSVLAGQAPGSSKAPVLSQTLTAGAEEFTIRYPKGWLEIDDAYKGAYLLRKLPRHGQTGPAPAQIMISFERRSDHADAIQRLREIDA